MNFLLSKSSILIMFIQIFLGFSIYDTSSNIIDNSNSQINQQEITMFNQRFLMYQGEQSGSVINQLITVIDTSNSTPDTPQQVTIYLDDATNVTSENITVTQKYNVYFHYGDNGYIDAVRINTVQ